MTAQGQGGKNKTNGDNRVLQQQMVPTANKGLEARAAVRISHDVVAGLLARSDVDDSDLVPLPCHGLIIEELDLPQQLTSLPFRVRQGSGKTRKQTAQRHVPCAMG